MQRDCLGLRLLARRIRSYGLKASALIGAASAPPDACRSTSLPKARHISACLFLFLIVITAHATTDTATAGRSAGVILVAATVDGQPATFLLDTGAERSCLDVRFVVRLRLNPTQPETLQRPDKMIAATRIQVRDLAIQSLHIRDIDMLSSDLSPISAGAGVPIDGILGGDILRRFTVRVNFSAGSAQFSANAATPAMGALVKLQSMDHRYFVDFRVQGAPLHLMLDTGANSSNLSSHAWSEITTHWRPQSMLNGVRSPGALEGTQFVCIPTIHAGGTTFTDVPIRLQPPTSDGLFAGASFDGLLGTDILRRFIVTLDLAHDGMYWTSDPERHADRYLFSTIGIQFAKDANGYFTIMAVWDPSPAAQAGLKIGDRVLAINRQVARTMSLDDFTRKIHGNPGTVVHLVVDSDRQQRTVTMQTTSLVCPARRPNLRH